MAEENNNSGKSTSEQPIIIKKIKKGGHGHHGGAWKVAYADFVTAMMAFFIVMWILAQSEETRAAISEYFSNPSEFNIFTGQKTSAVDLELPYPEKGSGKGKGDFSWSFSDTSNVDSVQIDAITSQIIQDSIAARQNVENSTDRIKESLNSLQNIAPDMSQLLESVSIEMTENGMKIELLEKQDNTFFEVGKARLKPSAVKILSQLAKEIGKLPNNVEIEGHTDSRKYAAGSTYSNWELSADRANSARYILENNGLLEGQVVSVSGLADRKLRSDNPFDAANRRISILVKNITALDLMNSLSSNVSVTN